MMDGEWIRLTPIIAVTNIKTHRNKVTKRIPHAINSNLSERMADRLKEAEGVPPFPLLDWLLDDGCC